MGMFLATVEVQKFWSTSFRSASFFGVVGDGFLTFIF